MEAEDVLVLSRKYTERLIQGAGDPAIVQNVTQLANITTNGKVHDIDFTNFIDGETIIAPATGWMYAETSRGQAGKSAYVNIYVSKNSVDFTDPSSHYYAALNDRNYEIGITSALVPVTKGDTVEIYFNQPLTALRIFEAEPIEPKYITSEKLLAEVNASTLRVGSNIQIDDLSSYKYLKVAIYNGSELYGHSVYDLLENTTIIYDWKVSATKAEVYRLVINKTNAGFTVAGINIPSGLSLTPVKLRFYGSIDVDVKDLTIPIVTDEKKLLYSGRVTTAGNITVNNLEAYDNVEISAYLTLSNGEKRIFESLPFTRELKHTTIISFELGNVQSFIEAEYMGGETIYLKNLKGNNLNNYVLYIEVYGFNNVEIKDLINPIVKDEEKLLYSGYVTKNGNVAVEDMSKYDKIYIKAFTENASGVKRLFDELGLMKEPGNGAHVSLYLNSNSLIGFYTLKYIDSTTVSISDLIDVGYNHEFYMEIYGYNEVLVNDLVNDLVIGDTVELYKGTPIKGNNKLNGKIEDYDYYMVELIYNNLQREQLFIKVGAPFNLLSPAGGTGYWEVIGTISGYDLNLSTLVIPSSASGVTIIRVTGIKTVTANSLIDKLVIRDSKELAEIPLSKSGDIKSQKVEGLENYDYFEVFFIDSNKKYSSAVNIVRYGESFMASNQYTANLHRSVLGNISNGSINIVEVNGNLYPSYVKVIGYKTVSADDISDIVVSDKAKLVAIKASEVVNGTKRTLPNDISYYDEIIAQLVIPTPNGKYVVETVPYFPEGLSEGLLVISKSYTYGNQDYRRVDIRFTGAEIELFNINIAPDRDDCDLILYGVKNTSVDDITTKLVIDKSVDTLLERTEISGVMEYELQKTVEPYGMIIAALYGEWASSGLAKVSEISLDAGVPSALIYNYDSDNRAFVNVKVEGSKATVSSFLKGSGIDRLYLKITNHKF